ncbi:MAG: bifunctional phosphoglucose/phosphomannose isomerase [Candidatus Methanoplasma sp.]|nr:bifunctional phosphoglucose/phosphomannose isomerase [Candidatus Methanoplasma sp.]
MKEKVSDSEMYKQVNDLPVQIKEALNAPLPPLPVSKTVCVCGMGASALAGEVVSDYADSTTGSPITVVRGIELPGWVGHETVVVCVSYSGNTKEVLMVYDEARSRGCPVVCITVGGELMQKCISHRQVLIQVPGGLQSRGAFGYLLGYLSRVLERMKICDAATALKNILPELKRHRDRLVSEENTLVEDIAKALLHKIPVIYSLANMRSSAIRWKTQINENSKFISFCGSLPEFNHNEIVGWTNDENNRMFMPVILYDDDASDIIRCMTDTSIGILRDKKLKIILYHVKGSCNLEKNLKCIIVGDFVSLQLAHLRKTDPVADVPVEEVNSLVIVDGDEQLV